MEDENKMRTTEGHFIKSIFWLFIEGYFNQADLLRRRKMLITEKWKQQLILLHSAS